MKKTFLLAWVAVLTFWSCQESNVSEVQSVKKTTPDVAIPQALANFKTSKGGRVEAQLKQALNSTLFAKSNYKISAIEVLTRIDASTSVSTLDQQFESTLSSRWVTNDTRRNWNGDNNLNDIDYMVFPPFSIANGRLDGKPTFDAMYKKWQNDGTCKTVSIDKTPYSPAIGNPSAILSIGGLAPAPVPSADVVVLGFLPPAIFEGILGSPDVLGVTFSFVFIDGLTGEPVRTTRGKEDKAYAEVWFNNGFRWSKGATPTSIDIESVVLHEFGHSLNLGHFGILQQFVQDGKSTFVYEPVNTMNAFYIGEPRNFLGENDKGNFCEAWGSWPWN